MKIKFNDTEIDVCLHEITDVTSSGPPVKTYDIEVEDAHCFTVKNPIDGMEAICHNSAMISLSNLSDDRMRNAKSGAWWETQTQRALANNSACYTERPDVGIFMHEWSALYESKSGERGIFNREAAKNVVKMNGRRNPDFEFGTNPCCVVGDVQIDVVCDGVEQRMKISDVVDAMALGKSFTVKSFDGDTIVQKPIVWSGATRKNAKLVKVTDTVTSKQIVCTPDHPIYTKNRGYVEASKLLADDELLILK